MRIHYLQHVPFEGLGYIHDWLIANDHSITRTSLYERSANLPSVNDFDGLIIMGGPMNVNEEQKYPWLAAEKTLIQEAVQTGKKLLGICLGAQLIAAAAGGQVFAHTDKEIGWFPVSLNKSLSAWLGRELPAEQIFIHWHGDTYTLPEGFINHASTIACAQQLYTAGNNIAGIQFHPEMMREGVNALVENDGDELQNRAFIQTKEIILDTVVAHFENTNAFTALILERLFNHP